MLEKQYTALAEGKWTPTARQFFTGNASVARSQLIDVGGFDERYRRAEDVELGYRLAKRGVEFVFNPRARGYHYANRSFRSWLDIASVYGRHDAVFFQDGEQRRWQTVKEEFAGRHKLNQALVRGCLDRPRLSELVSAMLSGLSVACHASGLERGSRAALSGLFNLRYYQESATKSAAANASLLTDRPEIEEQEGSDHGEIAGIEQGEGDVLDNREIFAACCHYDQRCRCCRCTRGKRG